MSWDKRGTKGDVTHHQLTNFQASFSNYETPQDIPLLILYLLNSPNNHQQTSVVSQLEYPGNHLHPADAYLQIQLPEPVQLSRMR